jgi:plasmid stability protein
MSNITISNLDDDIKYRLQKQAEKHGRSLEEEVKEILRLALLAGNHEDTLNIVTIIERRFANLGDFELPEVRREPIRTVSTFEE